MKTKISVGDKYYLQTAVQIAEEIKLQLIPMMVEIENEGEEDTYIMCRGIYRQMKGLIENLKEVSGGGNQGSNNESLCNKLEVSASKVEGLRAYIALLLESESDDQSAHLLSIALDIAFGIGKEIAQVRGLDY